MQHGKTPKPQLRNFIRYSRPVTVGNANFEYYNQHLSTDD